MRNVITSLIAAMFFFSASPEKNFSEVHPAQLCADTINAVTPELQVWMTLYHRRSGDLTSGRIQIKHDNDTIHFFKRMYSDRFRIYKLEYNEGYFAARKVTISGYRGSKKLYSTPALWRPDSTTEFQDTKVELKETQLKIEIIFEVLETREQRKWNINVLLDQDWN